MHSQTNAKWFWEKILFWNSLPDQVRYCWFRNHYGTSKLQFINIFRSHMLQADTEHMYQTWIKALQQGIGSAIQGNGHTGSKTNSSNHDDILKPAAGTVRSKPRYSVFFSSYCKFISWNLKSMFALLTAEFGRYCDKYRVMMYVATVEIQIHAGPALISVLHYALVQDCDRFALVILLCRVLLLHIQTRVLLQNVLECIVALVYIIAKYGRWI